MSLRSDWNQYIDLNKNQGTVKHLVKANFVWGLPTMDTGTSMAQKSLAAVVNGWQLSGVFTATSGTLYTMGYSYQSNGANVNLTGSSDFPAAIRITGNTGSGCSSNQYQQFNTAAFAGPLAGSTGLESGRFYMTGCKDHTLDLSLARTFKLGGSRTAQIRVDAFNAFNVVVYNSFVTTVQMVSPTNQTVVNSQTLADGTVDPNRLLPRNAGFGAVTGAQPLRVMQLQFRFNF